MHSIRSCVSWCIRQTWLSWRQEVRSRSLCTFSDHDPTKGQQNGAEAEIEKRAQEYLDGLDDDMKRKLAIIEMDYNIRLANDEPVPACLSNKQKKVLLHHCDTKEQQVEYLYHLKRNEDFQAQRNITRQENMDAMQFYPFQREGTFIFAETPLYDKMHYKFKMALGLVNGVPIVLDVGYGLTHKQNQQILNELCNVVMDARTHSQTPCVIVSGLSKNPIMKELVQDRNEITRMMVDFRDEVYEDIFPKSELVYLSYNGQEMTKFDGNSVHVIFAGTKYPRIPPDVKKRKFPQYRKRFGGKGIMLREKAKLIMDLSLYQDVATVMRMNVEEGLFQGSITQNGENQTVPKPVQKNKDPSDTRSSEEKRAEKRQAISEQNTALIRELTKGKH